VVGENHQQLVFTAAFNLLALVVVVVGAVGGQLLLQPRHLFATQVPMGAALRDGGVQRNAMTLSEMGKV